MAGEREKQDQVSTVVDRELPVDETLEVDPQRMSDLARQDVAAVLASDEREPFRDIGTSDYIVVEELGRGGVGQVLLGADRRLCRQVAVKRLLDPDPRRELRFVREMLITARLQHPSIVPIYEAGRWEDGALVYTMRKYDGKTLLRCLAGAELKERLGYLRSVIAAAEAIAYAHQTGVIHRDIKPSYLVVGDYGETVVIDWGLAKLLGDADDDGEIGESSDPLDSSLTVVGSALGTPHYMSPEQARGEAVDEKTDVYSLGACLYQILTGKLPPVSSDDSAEVILATEIEPSAPTELAAICRVAMSRDPSARPTAKKLADELSRFQTGALVELHDYTTVELVRRFVARHRLATAVAAVSIVLLAILGVRLVVEGRNTEAALADVVAQSDKLAVASARGLVGSDPLESIRALTHLGDNPEAWQRARVIASYARQHGLPIAVTRLDADAGELDLYEGNLIAASRSVAWFIDPRSREATRRQLPEQATRIDASHFVGFRGADAVVLDVASGEEMVLRSFDARPELLAASSDGAVFAAIRNQQLSLWIDGTLEFELGGTRNVVISADGTLFLLVRGPVDKPTVMLNSLASERTLREVDGFPSAVGDLRFLADNSVTLRFAHGLQIHWRADDSHHAICEFEPPMATNGSDYACFRSGRLVVSPFSAEYWTAAGITDLEIAGSVLTASSIEGVVHAWNYRATPNTLLQHPTSVRAVAIAADGRLVYSLADDGWIREWDISPIAATPLAKSAGSVGSVTEPLPNRAEALQAGDPRKAIALVPDAGGVAAVFVEPRTQKLLRQSHSAPEAQEIQRPEGVISVLRASDDGQWIAAAVAEGSGPPTTLEVLAAETVATEASLSFESEIVDIAFVKDSDVILVGLASGDIYRTDPASKTRSHVAKADGAIAAVAGHKSQVAFAATGDPTISLLDGKTVRSLRRHRVDVTGLDFSPTGDELVSVAKELVVVAWDTSTGVSRTAGRLTGSAARVRVSRSGKSIAAFGDFGLSLIDVATGETRTPTVSWVFDALFGDDDQTLWSTDGVYIRSFRDDLPRGRQALSAWIRQRLDDAPPPEEP